MDIKIGSQVIKVDEREPRIQALLTLLLAENRNTVKGAGPRFELNDFDRLWEICNSGHRSLLYEISKDPVRGVVQKELRGRLGVEPVKLRGMISGLARICARLGVQKPFRTEGYSDSTRIFRIQDKNIAADIQKAAAEIPDPTR